MNGAGTMHYADDSIKSGVWKDGKQVVGKMKEEKCVI